MTMYYGNSLGVCVCLLSSVFFGCVHYLESTSKGGGYMCYTLHCSSTMCFLEPLINLSQNMVMILTIHLFFSIHHSLPLSSHSLSLIFMISGCYSALGIQGTGACYILPRVSYVHPCSFYVSPCCTE